MIKQPLTVRKNYVFTPYIAADFVQLANKYKSRILMESGNKKANAKSLMGVLTIGLKEDDEIILMTDGPDEEKAMQDLLAFFNKD